MDRTRVGVLEAAARCIARDGVRRTTMAGIGNLAGVAKATLYNHFRSKGDVVAALADAEIARLGAEVEGVELRLALEHLANAVATHPVLRAVVELDPDLAVHCMAPSEGGAWDAAREVVSAVLGGVFIGDALDDVRVAFVLRWLASFVAEPGDGDDRKAGAALLAAGVRGHAVPRPGAVVAGLSSADCSPNKTVRPSDAAVEHLG